MGYRWPSKNLKYGNVKSGGFSSKLESAVYQILRLREKSGEISNIRCQHAVELTQAKIRCKIDFSYRLNSTDELFFVEAKGVETDRWRIIEKLWQFYGPAVLEIWGGTYRNPKTIRIITPGASRSAEG